MDRLLEVANPEIIEAHGRSYATDKLEALPSPSALANPLQFHTLSGLVDYLASGLDKPLGEGRAIHVAGPDLVALLGAITGEFRQRECLAKAEPFDNRDFPFDRYVDLETFITTAQQCFVATPERAALLRFLGSVTAESVATVDDDGVSQTVAARQGIQRVANVQVPNPVALRPFRTFPDVEQPESKYVLRLRGGGAGKVPEAGLFEVADGMWRLEAATSIRKRLGELLIVAGCDCKVFS